MCGGGGGGRTKGFTSYCGGCGPKVFNLTVGGGPKVLHLTVRGGPKVLHLTVGVWTKGFTSYWGRYTNILISDRKLLFSVQAGAVIALCVGGGGGGGGGGGIIIKDSN